MATIRKRVGKTRATCQAIVRASGYPTEYATFDRRGDAVDWAAQTEGSMRAGRYLDRQQVDALALYAENVSSKKAETTV